MTMSNIQLGNMRPGTAEGRGSTCRQIQHPVSQAPPPPRPGPPSDTLPRTSAVSEPALILGGTALRSHMSLCIDIGVIYCHGTPQSRPADFQERRFRVITYALARNHIPVNVVAAGTRSRSSVPDHPLNRESTQKRSLLLTAPTQGGYFRSLFGSWLAQKHRWELLKQIGIDRGVCGGGGGGGGGGGTALPSPLLRHRSVDTLLRFSICPPSITGLTFLWSRFCTLLLHSFVPLLIFCPLSFALCPDPVPALMLSCGVLNF